MKKAKASDVLGDLLKKRAAPSGSSAPVQAKKEQAPAPSGQPAPANAAQQALEKKSTAKTGSGGNTATPVNRGSSGGTPQNHTTAARQNPSAPTSTANEHAAPSQRQHGGKPKAAPKGIDGLLRPKQAVEEPPCPVVEQTPASQPSQDRAEPDLDLITMLAELLKKQGFAPSDVELLGALLWSLSQNENVKRPKSKWVVLHKEGPAFASVTSQDELPRVARKGDIVLLLAFLRTMLYEKLNAEVPQRFRQWAHPLLTDVPNALLLQAIGLSTLRWCLKNQKAPEEAWQFVCKKIPFAADEKNLIVNRLELLNQILSN